MKSQSQASFYGGSQFLVRANPNSDHEKTVGVVNPKALLKDFLLYVKHELWVPEHPVCTGLSKCLGKGRMEGRGQREGFPMSFLQLHKQSASHKSCFHSVMNSLLLPPANAGC